MQRLIFNIKDDKEQTFERTIDADIIMGITKLGNDGTTVIVGTLNPIDAVPVIETLLHDLKEEFDVAFEIALKRFERGITDDAQIN